MTLVAPLNWGLGHATRCVPIIHKLIASGEQIIIAADGVAFSFLQQEFPNLKIIRLRGYQMHYAFGRFLPIALMLQMPLFGVGILLEHRRLQKIVKQYSITKVISDNRYGLWNKNTENVIITHQLYIQLPKYLKFLQKPIHSFTAFLLHRFNQIWVPDYADVNMSLSGALSHGGKLDNEVNYIGPQSRFTADFEQNTDVQIPDVLLLLSGIGRQKKRLEKQVVNEYKNTAKQILIVGAEPNSKYQIKQDNVLKMNHISTSKLNFLLLHSPQIIARSGYSTIMDLHTVGRTAKLIPTPGQWEQIYLSSIR